MKIFIDTADIKEIEEAFSWGIIDGVTTNPSLIKNAVDKYKQKEELNMKDYIFKIFNAVKGKPVSLEVISTDYQSMNDEALKLNNIFYKDNKDLSGLKRIPVIKIPINPSLENKSNFESLRIIKDLKSKVETNCTLVMTPEQAYLAAKAGATYVSPFAGRIDDFLRSGKEFNKDDYYPKEGYPNKEDNGIKSGVDLIKQIADIYRIHNLDTKIIAASLRNSRQVREVALAGAHIATIPFSVLRKMICHKKTAEGMRKFTNDIVPEYAELFK